MDLEFSQYAHNVNKILINFTFKETVKQFINENGRLKKVFYNFLRIVCDNGKFSSFFI